VVPNQAIPWKNHISLVPQRTFQTKVLKRTIFLSVKNPLWNGKIPWMLMFFMESMPIKNLYFEVCKS